MITPSRLRFGLHTIAFFEAAKGILVLLVGLGLLPFIHSDLQELGELIVHSLNLNIEHRIPGIFLQLLDQAPKVAVIWLSLAAFCYSTVRLIEAYGLWKDRVWAEWLAIISSGLYLPFELYETIEKFSWIKLVIVIGNTLVVTYLLIVRHSKLRTSLESLALNR